MRKIHIFDFLTLIVGLAVFVLGFKLINTIYVVENEITWNMIMTLFIWLILVLVFIFLSISVDISRKNYALMHEIRNILVRHFGHIEEDIEEAEGLKKKKRKRKKKR